MRGFNELMKLRKSEVKPKLISVWVGNDVGNSHDWHKYTDTMEYPYLLIENDDNLDLIDYRVIAGADVLLRGDNVDRLLKVYSEMTLRNPKRLILIHPVENGAVEIMDTKGLLSGILE